jgi:hypothetical protein
VVVVVVVVFSLSLLLPIPFNPSINRSIHTLFFPFDPHSFHFISFHSTIIIIIIIIIINQHPLFFSLSLPPFLFPLVFLSFSLGLIFWPFLPLPFSLVAFLALFALFSFRAFFPLVGSFLLTFVDPVLFLVSYFLPFLLRKKKRNQKQSKNKRKQHNQINQSINQSNTISFIQSISNIKHSNSHSFHSHIPFLLPISFSFHDHLIDSFIYLF